MNGRVSLHKISTTVPGLLRLPLNVFPPQKEINVNEIQDAHVYLKAGSQLTKVN